MTSRVNSADFRVRGKDNPRNYSTCDEIGEIYFSEFEIANCAQAHIMTSPMQNCPSIDELICFCIGQILPYQIDDIFEHLESCRQCSAHVEKLDQFSIPFLEHIRHRGQTPETQYLHEQELRMAVQDVKTLLTCRIKESQDQQSDRPME